MQVFDQLTGSMHLFPDDIKPDEAQMAMGGFQQQQSQQGSVRAGLSGIGKMITDAMPINYKPQYATVNPKVAMAMTPQAMQNTIASQQGVIDQNQQQQFQGEQNAQDRSIRQQHLEQQQRQSIAYDLQREKDRAQQISLEDRRWKNQQKIEQMRQQQADAERERKEKQGTLRGTPGGGTAQVTYDENNNPVVNEIIAGRAPGSGGASGGGSGEWMTGWVQDASGQNVFSRINRTTGEVKPFEIQPTSDTPIKKFLADYAQWEKDNRKEVAEQTLRAAPQYGYAMSPEDIANIQNVVRTVNPPPPAPGDMPGLAPTGYGQLLPQNMPPAPQSQISQPQTEEDYNALPSGATYIAPDGTTRRKP